MEEWRKMIYPKISSEYNHYEVSNEGRIKNILTGRVLQQETLRTGYNSVRVNCDGKRKHIIIHKAIAYTFLDPPETSDKMCINHKDNIRTNNSVDNLEWCTPSYNQRYKYETKSFDVSRISGENNHNAKLTKEKVLYAREHVEKGSKEYGIRPLARKFGVSSTTMKRAIDGNGWTNF